MSKLKDETEAAADEALVDRDYYETNDEDQAFLDGYLTGAINTPLLWRAIDALEEIKAFWADIETPKPYFIGDKCDEALAEIRQAKGELK